MPINVKIPINTRLHTTLTTLGCSPEAPIGAIASVIVGDIVYDIVGLRVAPIGIVAFVVFIDCTVFDIINRTTIITFKKENMMNKLSNLLTKKVYMVW